MTDSNKKAIVTDLKHFVDQWCLQDIEIAVLLGVTDEIWARIKTNDFPDPLSSDVLTRAGILIRIKGNLEVIFAGNAEGRWLKSANSTPLFKGETPVAHMIKGGLPAMAAVQNYLEAVMYS